jgi:protoheme IX farnesyltransferase
MMATMTTIQNFYSLTKPGVLYGNAITVVAGFLLGSGKDFELPLFLATIIGVSLLIASACVINNFFDQDIDKIMARTKNRAIVNGSVRSRDALVFGIILGLVGSALLLAYANLLTFTIGFLGFIVYVFLYGMLSKRLSMHGTLVGAVSGAAPILAGYVGATNHLDITGVLAFLVIFLWQMPEFYSIAIFRAKEYKAAGVPVITVVKGLRHTAVQIFAYTVTFVITTLLLTILGSTGLTYLTIMACLGAYWIVLGYRGLHASDILGWSHKMFHYSLIMLLVFSLLISVDAYLP